MPDNVPAISVMYRRESDPAGLAEESRRVESLGFEALWIVEDCFYMGGISQAAIALASTTTLKIGIGINPGVAHNAAILAMEYATLARAFPGRLIGGIGHGVESWMEQIGESVSSPLTAIEETTTAIRQLLHGERISIDGRYVRLDDVQLQPPPEVVPPILLGVHGPKSIALAGRIADGVLLAENAAPHYVRQSRAILDGERSKPGYIGVYTCALVDNDYPNDAHARMRHVIAGLNSHGLSAQTSGLSFAAELQAMANEGGAANLEANMPSEWVQQLGLVGTRDEVLAGVEAYAAAGADAVILVPSPDWEWNSWLKQAATLLQ
ncbi:MAG: LLM class flavin-dependent oxidoreductase [Thermomicrobiales bacterium]|nr:LLM class flavin-dependent oxidoreductase [Thermomicrobiales bacterium]